VTWEKRPLRNCNSITYLGLLLSWSLFAWPAQAQMYYSDNNYGYQSDNNYGYQQQYGAGQEPAPNRTRSRARQPVPETYQQRQPVANLQYDQRDAEQILQEQMTRSNQQLPAAREPQQQVYDNAYGHRISDEGQVQRVMAEARSIANFVRSRNGKAFIVFDKRNVQFYLYDRTGKLLRIGPVAIGKGKTESGAFETPVGVFPIKSKSPVDDWIRPDWYFVEEGEPIPKRWEDRRVPGFFRYKLVFDGTRYVHYAEATGGRLTHGCLGLDWEDAEAVFHTLEVGSYCIIVDRPFLIRLARGEFPVQKPPAPKPAREERLAEDSPPPPSVTDNADGGRSGGGPTLGQAGSDPKVFRSLW
jgi:lipoprotein-anchoring transpeptidase ErfK/SrfK